MSCESLAGSEASQGTSPIPIRTAATPAQTAVHNVVFASDERKCLGAEAAVSTAASGCSLGRVMKSLLKLWAKYRAGWPVSKSWKKYPATSYRTGTRVVRAGSIRHESLLNLQVLRA